MRFLLPVIFLTGLLLFAQPTPPPAYAGVYEVVSCNNNVPSPINGENTNSSPWGFVTSRGGDNGLVEFRNCPQQGGSGQEWTGFGTRTRDCATNTSGCGYSDSYNGDYDAYGIGSTGGTNIDSATMTWQVRSSINYNAFYNDVQFRGWNYAVRGNGSWSIFGLDCINLPPRDNTFVWWGCGSAGGTSGGWIWNSGADNAPSVTLSGPQMTGNQGNPTILYYVMQCTPTGGDAYCRLINRDDFVNKAGRARYSYQGVRMVDYTGPSTSFSGGNLFSGNWVRGTQTGNISASDNTGIWTYDIAIDNNAGSWVSRGYSNRVNSCPGRTSYSVYQGAARWLSQVPCPDLGSTGISVNTNDFSNGAHAVKARATDSSANAGETNGTIYIDNQIPSVGITTPANSGGWIRGTITVNGSASDGHSGVDSSSIQRSINGGAWSTLCSGTSCSFDSNTSATPSGATVAFRQTVSDNAGNSNTSGATTTLSVDNVAPTVGPITFSPVSTPNEWTNDATTDVSWPTVSPDTGSPITYLRYYYTNGTGSGCSTSSPSTLVPGGGAATDTTVNNQPVTCQQGVHTVRVWAYDQAGNATTATPYASVGTYKYDSIEPVAPTGLAITPATWTQTNNFAASWTNSTYNNTTSSPIVRHRYRINNVSPAVTNTGCLGSGAACSITGLVVNTQARGIYPFKLWQVDEAGNGSEDNSDVANMYYDPADVNTVCPLN